jgi:Domain of unknown function (DUF222)/HNH endonuclease
VHGPKIGRMSVAVAPVVDPRVALAALQAALDELSHGELTGLSDEDLLEFGRVKERAVRRLAAVDHAFVLEVQARQLPAAHAVRGTGAFLRALLRLDPREAAGRVRAAEAAGSRRALTGELRPAPYPLVAAAQQAGTISPRQAQIIVDCVEKLPDEPRTGHGAEIEATLVRHAGMFDPVPLARLAQRIRDWYDPDGPDPDGADSDDGHRQRSRELSLTERSDGSGILKGELTAELVALLRVHFDALAAPNPEQDGVKDPRTAGQRRHDALLAALKLVLRAEQLPAVAGVTATIVLTMTLQQYQTGQGLARTAHGTLIPVREAFRAAGGDYRLLAVVLSRLKAVEAYSSTHRLFTENQRLALHALDGGCTFPNCSAPPGWCQTHHLKPWSEGGETSLENVTLLCDYEHTHRINQGWTARRINGRVAWTPPAWIDPDRTPRYNHLHLPWQAVDNDGLPDVEDGADD